LLIHGVVQGVGFRPFVYRLAKANALAGWVLNGETGVAIHVEGDSQAIGRFERALAAEAPPAARIVAIESREAAEERCAGFTIRESERHAPPTVLVSPDLPVCEECLRELFHPGDQRYLYPYINCTNCGPRYTVITALPYDRANTTLKDWPLCMRCADEYHDPANRRFHAQPVACPECGPKYRESFAETAAKLRAGEIVAVKGLGGYVLACDARNTAAVTALRERKFRKEKPFALMARNLDSARAAVRLSPEEEALLTSAARPIVLAKSRIEVPGVAPATAELGIMLPYAPVHHLLFAAGAPELLVMTSANRSNEPIAYEDGPARESLAGIADSWLVGERPIARRVDDSVARVGAYGPVILRRARGYAPGAVATIPTKSPVLALGADLKNTVTLVVGGQAFMSQHIGDLDDAESYRAFTETVRDLLAMYEVDENELTVVKDAHPEYRSAFFRPGRTVQHHRAHVASVLAERGEFEKRVIGVSFDGTGWGDDGTIWGGEFFAGSVAEGFARVAHLREALLVGGDAAARHPVQAAAGFLAQVDGAEMLGFPRRFDDAIELVRKNVRCFRTTSMGRLFDTAAAILGFHRPITFEGQAAMWLEHEARRSATTEAYPFPDLDFRPLLEALIRGRDALAFHRGIARGLCKTAARLCEEHGTDTVVLSGGVFQNQVLMELIRQQGMPVWTNREVPPNDGGISLGQAAISIS
jgi:hydrogenase maturation protein HypF